MLVVTGANGFLGRSTATHLLDRVEPSRLAVTTRNPGGVAEFAERGAEVRYTDFDDHDSMVAAFRDAERLLIVATRDSDDLRLARHKRAIDAARRAGVPHVFYTSQIAPSPDCPLGVIRVHYHTEQYLRQSGLPHTIFQNAFYTEEAVPYAMAAIKTGVLESPADGPVSYASRDDLGEAQAVVMAEGSHLGETLELTATESFDHAELARRLSQSQGREITRVVVDDNAFGERLRAAGYPQQTIDWILGMFLANRTGCFNVVSPTMGEILGRDPVPFDSALEAALAAGRISPSEIIGEDASSA